MLTPTYYIISYGISVLGIFAKLRKATIGFVMSAHSSIRMEQLGSNWTDFHELWYLSTVWKSVKKIQVSLKSDKNNWYFTWRPIHFWSYLAYFFLEWKMFQTKVVEKIKTHILCSITFFQELCHLWDNAEKYCRVGQAGHRWQYDTCTLHAGYLRLHTHTHSEYVTLIAFQCQQWLQQQASMLHYMYTAHLVDLALLQEYNYGVKQRICVHLLTIMTEFTNQMLQSQHN